MERINPRRVVLGLCLAVLAMSGNFGCLTPSKTTWGKKRIIRVSTFYNTRSIWLNFDHPPTRVPQGLKFTVFLTAVGNDLGVFGDGTLMAEMFRIEQNAEGVPIRVPVKKWSFNNEQAYVFRKKEPTRYGWAYGLRLAWGDADVLGREIEVIASFKRRDGTVIYGRPMLLKVPKRVYDDRP